MITHRDVNESNKSHHSFSLEQKDKLQSFKAEDNFNKVAKEFQAADQSKKDENGEEDTSSAVIEWQFRDKTPKNGSIGEVGHHLDNAASDIFENSFDKKEADMKDNYNLLRIKSMDSRGTDAEVESQESPYCVVSINKYCFH